ncbi:hypothetical protein HY464_02810 [Candidatus Peregrinibacteria bacterium]|nr:hypothetical protein [Candidatus Peregrinibacteria bacterium]
MDQELLYQKLKRQIRDPLLLRSVSRILTPVVIREGSQYDWFCHGIPKGVGTSPLFAWFYLAELDSSFARLAPQVYYQRFCDDILVLTQTRRQLRRAIQNIRIATNRNRLKLRVEKTYVGKTADPLFYLGYAIHGHRVSIIRESLHRMHARVGSMGIEGRSLEEMELYLKRWLSAFPTAECAPSAFPLLVPRT